MTTPDAGPPRIFYGWYIVGSGTLSSFLSVAIFLHSMGTYITDMREELGWSMTAISLGFSLKSLPSGLLAPLIGYLIDRLGPRLIATIGAILLTAGLLLFAGMNSLWMFYLASTVMSLGQGMSMTPYSVAIVNWFARRRGRASSLLSMGQGSGYVGVYPITLFLILLGWRQAAVIAALFYAAISLPLAQVIRHRPGPYGYLPDGEPLHVAKHDVGTHNTRTAEEADFGVKDALRSSKFWLVLFTIALQSFHNNIFNVHMIPHMRNVGFSAGGAALVISVYGIIQTIGRPLFGWIGDKVGRYHLLMASQPIMAIGWIPIAFISPNPWILALYFMFAASGHAAHRAVDQAVVADFFGTWRYGTIRGMISSISQVGNIIGPLFAGLMFDTFGSFRLAFLILVPVAALGIPALMVAGRPAPAETPVPTIETQGNG